MKRVIAGVISAAIIALASAQPAQARGLQWCEEDPILMIDGRVVDYTAAIPTVNLPGTTVHWVFHIPSNVVRASAVTPPALGSKPIPSTVAIYRDLAPYKLLSAAAVRTTVTVSGTGQFPTIIKVKGTNAVWTTYDGRSNTSLSFGTSFTALPLVFAR